MKVLITGGQSQIGRAIADHRQTLGDKVILTSSVEKNLKTFGASFEKFQFDLSNPEASNTAIDQILKVGAIEAVILNAATTSPRLAPLDRISFGTAKDFLSANLCGNIWLLQKLLPEFQRQKFGRIVFISSLLTEHPLPGYSVYSAAKAGMESLLEYVALEYGAFNVTANTIRLGIIQTERNKAFWRRDGIRKQMEKRISLGRLGQPKDLFKIIDAILEKDSYLQGSSIDISGGLHTPP